MIRRYSHMVYFRRIQQVSAGADQRGGCGVVYEKMKRKDALHEEYLKRKHARHCEKVKKQQDALAVSMEENVRHENLRRANERHEAPFHKSMDVKKQEVLCHSVAGEDEEDVVGKDEERFTKFLIKERWRIERLDKATQLWKKQNYKRWCVKESLQRVRDRKLSFAVYRRGLPNPYPEFV